MVEATEREIGRIRRKFRLLRARRHEFGSTQAGRATEHHEIDQRVRAEAVRAMHRHAGRFAYGHQAGTMVSGLPPFMVTTSP